METVLALRAHGSPLDSSMDSGVQAAGTRISLAGVTRVQAIGTRISFVGVKASMSVRARLNYKEVGVDIDTGAELVRRIARMTPGIDDFGGFTPIGDLYLVIGTDGVGTKLKVALALNKHDTIDIDLVAMNVNDIVNPMQNLSYSWITWQSIVLMLTKQSKS